MSAIADLVHGAGELGYLAWLAVLALPVLGGQWIAFPGFLARTSRRWLPVSAALAAWFMTADAVGIAAGVWRIGGPTTVGVRLAGVLPLEEALFFVATTLMVAQTVALFLWRFGDVPGEPWPGWASSLGRGTRRQAPPAPRRRAAAVRRPPSRALFRPPPG